MVQHRRELGENKLPVLVKWKSVKEAVSERELEATMPVPIVTVYPREGQGKGTCYGRVLSM